MKRQFFLKYTRVDFLSRDAFCVLIKRFDKLERRDFFVVIGPFSFKAISSKSKKEGEILLPTKCLLLNNDPGLVGMVKILLSQVDVKRTFSIGVQHKSTWVAQVHFLWRLERTSLVVLELILVWHKSTWVAQVHYLWRLERTSLVVLELTLGAT